MDDTKRVSWLCGLVFFRVANAFSLASKLFELVGHRILSLPFRTTGCEPFRIAGTGECHARKVYPSM
jgi:hypothetical protein